MARQPTANESVGSIVMIAGVITLLGGCGVFAFQAYNWLRTGNWSPLEMLDLVVRIGLPRPSVSWLGVQKILDWLLAAPLNSGLFALGLGIAWLGGAISESGR